ncbi:coiled-coil domain-containing protein 112 [Microcaecilia unicolor]|uniref:Coiled-coil domain-containing protein 112 n=1 Tax=Microcaecilia unicolor TaxID=1415580 RepID=A0A6P7XFC9_9AMPH|nr:coiled-coil domain-containing protein 112 [Microcaecilia unicolor]
MFSASVPFLPWSLDSSSRASGDTDDTSGFETRYGQDCPFVSISGRFMEQVVVPAEAKPLAQQRCFSGFTNLKTPTPKTAADARPPVKGTATSPTTSNESSLSFSGGDSNFHARNWKIKADQAKKATFIREAEKLKHQIAVIEKSKNGHLYNKKSEFRAEYSTLEEHEHKLTNNRKAERVKTEQELSRIHNNVKRFQQQLKDVKPTPEFVDKLREMMEEIENAISTFKEEQRLVYEELLKEEKTVMNELTALEKRIETWMLDNSAVERGYRVPSGKAAMDKEMVSQLPKEVLEFERFLQQTGGRQGGWDDYDHQNFLKVLVRQKGKLICVEEALEYLPGRTREEIQQHEKWYQEFLFLEEKKKEAIQTWKLKKMQEREKLLMEHGKSKEVLELERLARIEAQKEKLEEERKRQQEKLETWRQQKELEAAKKQAAQRKEEEEKERRQKQECQRQLEVKLLVEEYARQKRKQEEFLRLEQLMQEEAEREERQRSAAAGICKFQERDFRKLELKALNKRAKEEELAEKEKRLSRLKEKVEIHVKRDASRVCKLTKGWEERTKTPGPVGGSGPLLHIPHRSVPSWRQGL